MSEEKQEEETDVDVFEESRSKDRADLDRGWIKLPSADLLTITEADELLRWRPAHVVAIVGERNGGKTTLITEVYERFLRGAFAGQLFAHSRTLHGFEKKSYPSRADSERLKPDTGRTSALDGLRFFHLGLVSQDTAQRVDLLISERAGETYRDARDNPAASAGFEELRKAKTVAFILDGARLANGRTRAEAFASVRSMIRGFSDAGAISSMSEVQLVTTKYDLLAPEPLGRVRDALAEFEQQFAVLHESRFAKVATWRTAARDPKGKFDPAWGLPPLLQSWLGPPKYRPAVTALPELHDEFDRLLLRRER